ncbi:MAG: hypothetical protein ACYTDY_16470 [Planctomycetota bacterium]|jgi:hypothetical protein
MVDVYRFKIEVMSRTDEEATDDRLRELGLDGWNLVSVLPGSRENPEDAERLTFFFRRDATTDIGL